MEAYEEQEWLNQDIRYVVNYFNVCCVVRVLNSSRRQANVQTTTSIEMYYCVGC